MAKFHWNVDQGSVEWYRLRSGVPTASMFDKIITPAKKQMSASRWPYACRLIAERLLRWQPANLDHLKNIEAGKENEPIAIKQFEFVTQSVTRPVGFVTTNDGRFGASPDRVLGYSISDPPPSTVSRIAEVKCPTIPVQMERLVSDAIVQLDPKAKVHGGEDYKCQVQGQLFVAEADESLYYSYHPMMPAYQLRTHRDDAFIHSLKQSLEQFSDELEHLFAVAKTLGTYEMFAELKSAADVTLGPGTTQELADMIEGELGDKFAWGA